MSLNWLLAPKTGDESQNFAYQALHYTLVLFILISSLVVFSGDTLVHKVFVPIFICTFILCYILLQYKQLQIATTIFLVSFWIFISAAVIGLNGIHNALIYTYVIVIIYTNLLYKSRRVVFFVTLLSCISATVLYVTRDSGLIPLTRTDSPVVLDRLFTGFAIFGASGILLSTSAHALRSSLERARQSEQQLQIRNQELETLTEKLRVSEERYRILFENSGLITVVYNEDEKVVLANQLAASSVDRTPETMIGMSIRDIFSETADMVSQKHRDALEADEMVLFEGQIKLPSGLTLDYLRHVIPLPQSREPDELRQVLVLTTDITERKRAEQRDYELTLAQEKLQFFTNFFGTVSHDIKTPLSTMNTSLYLLEKSTDNPEHHSRIERLKAQVKLIQAYIQNMLMVAQLEHIPVVAVAGVKLEHLVVEAVDIHMPLIEQKSLNYHVTIPDALIIEVDHEQFRRMMLNLIENAVNYTTDGGMIQINATQDDQIVQIEVIDSGMGIPADDLGNIFEPFYRASEAKARLSSGTGLGLAIVKRIVDLHQGEITVNSKVGKGTTFTIHLPVGNK